MGRGFFRAALLTVGFVALGGCGGSQFDSSSTGSSQPSSTPASVAQNDAPPPPPGKSLDTSRWEPQFSIVIVEAEEDGKVVRAVPSGVAAVDDVSAYLSAQYIVAPPHQFRPPDEPLPTTRYFARFGPPNDERRVELREVVTLEESQTSYLAGPCGELPAPPPKLVAENLEVFEGQTLTFVGMRKKSDSYPPSFETVRESVKVARISSGSAAPTRHFELAGRGGIGFLLDGEKQIGSCSGDHEHFYGFLAAPGLATHRLELQALRIRISRPAEDDAVVEFAARTIDPYRSNAKLQMLVAYPPKSELDKPNYELRGGRESFIVQHGKWLRPPEGTVVEMRRVEAVDGAFELSAAPDPWCRSAVWYGEFRFRPSNHPKVTWYKAVSTDGNGLFGLCQLWDSHLDFDKKVGEALRYKHPAHQFGQPVSVPMPAAR